MLDDSTTMKQQTEAKKNDIENERGKVDAENIQEEINVEDRGKSKKKK